MTYQEGHFSPMEGNSSTSSVCVPPTLALTVSSSLAGTLFVISLLDLILAQKSILKMPNLSALLSTSTNKEEILRFNLMLETCRGTSLELSRAENWRKLLLSIHSLSQMQSLVSNRYGSFPTSKIQYAPQSLNLGTQSIWFSLNTMGFTGCMILVMYVTLSPKFTSVRPPKLTFSR